VTLSDSLTGNRAQSLEGSFQGRGHVHSCSLGGSTDKMDDQLTCRCGDKAALLDAASLSERMHVMPVYLVV
jgi:hypothetical protein